MKAETHLHWVAKHVDYIWQGVKAGFISVKWCCLQTPVIKDCLILLWWKLKFPSYWNPSGYFSFFCVFFRIFRLLTIWCIETCRQACVSPLDGEGLGFDFWYMTFDDLDLWRSWGQISRSRSKKYFVEMDQPISTSQKVCLSHDYFLL